MQVTTAQGTMMSGPVLWTTDIGGFTGPPGGTCTPGNSSYDELVTRWFQFGCTCPIFRQHGSRPTELWHYGPEAEATITEIIKWRVTMKPYLAQEMAKLNATGRPINRPLWWCGEPLMHAFLMHHSLHENDQYTKTGSGHKWGLLRKKEFFLNKNAGTFPRSRTAGRLTTSTCSVMTTSLRRSLLLGSARALFIFPVRLLAQQR